MKQILPVSTSSGVPGTLSSKLKELSDIVVSFESRVSHVNDDSSSALRETDK